MDEKIKILGEHTITEVRYGRVRNCWPRLIGKNGKVGIHGYGYLNPIVIIKTDTGLMGWGYGVPDRTLKLCLEGKKVSEIFSPSVGLINPGFAAADLALHDLAGRILGLPVSKMISSNSPMKAACYDGAIYFNDLTETGDKGVEAVLQDCRDDYERGFRDFKVKIGRSTYMGVENGIKRDVDIIRQIRKEFPQSKIMVDANDSMTLEMVIQFMEGVKDCSIYWIEEPFVENYDECMKLKEYLAKNSPDTMIADGEFYCDHASVIKLAKQGAIDCLLMDPESFGFSAWRRLVAECENTSIKCSPHGWGTMLKTNAVAHLTALYPTVCPTIEGMPETIEGVDTTGYSLNDGILTIPEKPGFGMDLEFASPLEIYRPY